MKIFKLFWFLFYCSQLFAMSESDLAIQNDCHRLQGELFETWHCPTNGGESEARLYFCKVQSKTGNWIVFDGCSTPTNVMPFYTDFFYEACKRHDICYHNTIDHTTKGKKTCDLNFYYGMIATCKNRLGDQSIWEECGNSAALFYQAVETFGQDGYNCSNIPLDSNEYTPLYDTSVF